MKATGPSMALAYLGTALGALSNQLDWEAAAEDKTRTDEERVHAAGRAETYRKMAETALTEATEAVSRDD